MRMLEHNRVIYHVDQPILLINGEKDRATRPEHSELFAMERMKIDKPTEHVIIKNAGHSPHRTKAEITAEHIRKFLNK